MKGELWPGNEGSGLVHRSPAIAARALGRLVVLMDSVL